jgi:hypothetical protein
MEVEKSNIPHHQDFRTLLVYFFGFLLFIPFACILLLQNSHIQQYISQKITDHFARRTGMMIKFEKLQYTFFHQLEIKNLIIADSLNDTLIFAPELIVDLQAVFFRHHQLVFNRFELKQPRLYLSKDSSGQFNWEKLFRSTASADTSATTGSKWNYKFRNINIENADIAITGVLDSTQLPAWYKTHLSHVVFRARNLLLGRNSVEVRINRFGFVSHNGFHLINIGVDLSFKQRQSFTISKFSLVTPESDIDIKQLSFDLTQTVHTDQMPIAGIINLSKINLFELGFFLPQWHGRRLVVKFNGEVKGTLSDLRIKNFFLSTGEKNFFKGSIHYTQLPDLNEPYLYLDVKEMQANIPEIQRIINVIGPDTTHLPEILKRLEYFGFKGNFTGFPTDFVAFGTLQSPMGTLKLDIALKPSSKYMIGYNGTLEAIQLKIGELLGNSRLVGPTHLTLTAQGNIVRGRDVNGTITLNILTTSVNGYLLQNLSANGTIENKVFQGKTIVDDPNLQFETSGRYSLSDSFPVFNFSAHVKKINLSAFHILPQDSIHHLQANIEANFVGNSINEFDGDIHIKNLTLKNRNTALTINNIDINAFNNKKINATVISSELFDMQIKGKYHLGSILEDLKFVVKRYIPSMPANVGSSEENEFTFNILLKHPQPIFDFFFPTLKLADSSNLTGIFRPAAGKLDITANAGYLQMGSVYFEQPVIKLASPDSSLQLNLSIPMVHAGDMLPFAQFTATFNLSSHYARFNATWYDSLAHLNEIRLIADSIGFWQSIPVARIMIEPSRVYIRGEAWTLTDASLKLDTPGININHFRLSHLEKEININGWISKHRDDSLFVTFRNLDLSFLNYLLQTKSFQFDGKINGSVTANEVYRLRHITGSIAIQSLEINHTQLGNIQIAAQWNPDKESVDIQLTSSDTLARLLAHGNFYPLRRSYSFDGYFNQVDVKIIEPIIAPTFAVKNGTFSGHLHLSDETSKPVIDGKLALNNAVLELVPLHASYSISNTLVVDHNTFLFKNFVLYDESQHPLRLNGQLRNNYLKNFTLDFKLTADNNLVFNKPAADELPFYGKAFVSGKVHIYSTDDFIVVDVTDAKTEENTLVLVDLGQSYYSGTNDFIRFTPPASASPKTSNGKSTPVVSDQKKSRLSLNMDVEVNPQAELMLLLSTNRGDVLRGRGNGSLKFEVDKAGNFFIRGQYSFTEGIYNFTMNNLMNKKFEIQNSSTIYFNGRPTDATLDITAIYHTRAPLYNLFGESNIEYRKRIPVDCQLFLTGRLMEPNIRLSIDLPNAAEETKSRVRSIISSEQEMSQQFLSLMLLNNFMPATSGNLQTRLQETNLGVDVAATTSLELLFSQLSSWLSSFNKDFNFGVSYRPGDQVYTNEDLEIALSTQLLNNRMSISSSIDIIGQSNTPTATRQSSTLVGDVNVEYRLTDRLSLKAFNRPNDIIYFQDDIYTRGVGIIYREEFKDLKELTQRYFRQKQKQKSKDSIPGN